PEEDLFVLFPEGYRAQFFTHPPLADHLARHLGSSLDIVPSPGCHRAEDDLLGGTSPHQDSYPVKQRLFGVAVLVLDRELHCHAKSSSARDDGYLVDRVGPGKEFGNKGMTSLMIGSAVFLLLGDHHAAPLNAHQHLVLGVVKVDHLNLLLVSSCRKEGSLIDCI